MAKDQSKTEKATPKQREKQRKEGNVPKGQEIIKTISILIAMVVLYLYFGIMFERLKAIASYFFKNAADFTLNETEMSTLFFMVVMEFAILVAPVIVSIFVAVIITQRWQVGPLWTTEVFKMRWDNFNLIKGIQKLFFSSQTVARLLRSIALALVIGYIPYRYIMNEYPKFIYLYHSSVEGFAHYLVENAFWMVMYTLFAMIIISIADLAYTRYDYEENIKMSKQEIKDEYKQTEGSPEVKQKQKQKMFEIMTNRMMRDIPRADVIITNPTHFAVALMYDPMISNAPLVVAKGVDHLAQKIKEIASEHDIPIKENRPLARALYDQVEVGDMIPEDLYKAVAAILAEIWKLKGKKIK